MFLKRYSIDIDIVLKYKNNENTTYMNGSMNFKNIKLETSYLK